MMSLTHLTVSALSTAIVLGVADPIVLGAGAVAGLLPDVDVAKSPAGRILSPLSRWLEQRYPHRSCTTRILNRWGWQLRTGKSRDLLNPNC